MKIPRWMKAIITTEFYIKCGIHREVSETKFCKDCVTSFCPDCNSVHQNHKTLTVYKASKAVAVRTKDLNDEESLDPSDICDYSINNRNIYFVHKKSHRSSSSNSSSSKQLLVNINNVGGAATATSQVAECEVCCYRLVKPDRRFCSVECKVAAVEQQDQTTVVDRKTSSATVYPGIRSVRRRRIRKQFKPSRAPSF